MFMVNFSLTMHYKYSLNELEGLIPWERDAYLKLITSYVEAENERIRAEQTQRK
jgi:hypothetical protein